MSIIKLDSNTFTDGISKGITLVDFYADWCGPCKMIAPFVDQVADETDITVAKLDVDAAQDISEKYDVMSIPTLILFKDGEIVDQKMGFMTKDQIMNMIEQAK